MLGRFGSADWFRTGIASFTAPITLQIGRPWWFERTEPHSIELCNRCFLDGTAGVADASGDNDELPGELAAATVDAV